MPISSAIDLIGQATAVHIDAADVAPAQPALAYELVEAQRH
jgi:hypothetical protein